MKNISKFYLKYVIENKSVAGIGYIDWLMFKLQKTLAFECPDCPSL